MSPRQDETPAASGDSSFTRHWFNLLSWRIKTNNYLLHKPHWFVLYLVLPNPPIKPPPHPTLPSRSATLCLGCVQGLYLVPSGAERGRERLLGGRQRVEHLPDGLLPRAGQASGSAHTHGSGGGKARPGVGWHCCPVLRGPPRAERARTKLLFPPFSFSFSPPSVRRLLGWNVTSVSESKLSADSYCAGADFRM